MPKKIKEIKPPSGLSRLLYRFPILLFRIGLGGLMGKRALLLNHVGRKSGLPRQVVLEVVHHDPKNNSYIINAGFGPKSQWYQNILVHPDVTIQLGRKKLDMRAMELPRIQGGEILLNFIKQHPSEAGLFKMIGHDVDGTDKGWRALGKELIFIRLSPR